MAKFTAEGYYLLSQPARVLEGDTDQPFGKVCYPSKQGGVDTSVLTRVEQ